MNGHPEAASVLLYWLPLGAGGHSVRWNGRLFEAFAARHERRAIQDLYHSALEVHVGGDRFVIEMTPAWGAKATDRGVVREGPVGSRRLGHFVAFGTRSGAGTWASSQTWTTRSPALNRSVKTPSVRGNCRGSCRIYLP